MKNRGPSTRTLKMPAIVLTPESGLAVLILESIFQLGMPERIVVGDLAFQSLDRGLEVQPRGLLAGQLRVELIQCPRRAEVHHHLCDLIELVTQVLKPRQESHA